jgi:hypothetical protein
MKTFSVLLCVVVFLSAAASLQATDLTLYGGLQKAGKLKLSAAAEIPSNLLEGQFGGTYGIRFSAGRIIGFEQNISYSPRFAKRGVNAFQMDTNLLLQSRKKVTPYASAGLGYIYTWGQDTPVDADLIKAAAFAYCFGNKFALNYGGGIKARRLMGPLGFSIDMRGYTIPGVYEGTLNFYQTSLGLLFTW